ncbi:MAG TPA: exosortase-associated EpsI family protein [Gemmataceae bacterium]|nr:exosortase-associated EpsI family protein [Gemmataceae bacterium]
MKQFLLITATVLIVGFGIWEANWTGRFSLSNEPKIAADKMSSVPLTIGDWTGTARDLAPRQVARAEMTGYLLRTYVNSKSEAIQVLLVCGRPGPTSLHPPNVCYQGAGYQLMAAPVKHTITGPSPNETNDFWMAGFQKTGPNVDPLRIFWAWTATGAWAASDNPRWTFGSQHFLYKLYIIRALPRLDEPLENDPAIEFMREFLPELRKSLFSPASQSQSSVWRHLPAAVSSGRWS